MKTKLFIIALALSLLCSCEKPDQENPIEKLPPLENVDDVCTKMVDLEFMKYCYENFDVNKDGKVSMLEANAHSLEISCHTATDFTGIEYFTNLERFCSKSVKTVNLSYNKQLKSVNCSYAPLEIMDLRHNTSITHIVFYDCKKLTKILLADQAPLKYVTCEGCEALTTMSLPDNCTTIYERAFYRCTNLSQIKFPKKLTTIGVEAFKDCRRLESVTIFATDPPEVSQSSFNYVIPYLYVPSGSVEAYRSSLLGLMFTNIVAIE